MAEFLIALLELFEAEGRALRRNAFRVGLGAVLVALAGTLLALTAALLLWALYLALAPRLGPPGALLVCGLVTAAAAGGSLWGARRITH